MVPAAIALPDISCGLVAEAAALQRDDCARPKTNISVGFGFGSLSLQDLSVSP